MITPFLKIFYTFGFKLYKAQFLLTFHLKSGMSDLQRNPLTLNRLVGGGAFCPRTLMFDTINVTFFDFE